MIFETWSRVREWLLPAIALLHGSYTEDDVLVRWLAGTYRLWEKDKSVVLTEIGQFPQGNLISIALAGGDKAQIKETVADIEHYARENKYKGVLIVGRDGWRREFPDYIFSHVTLYKELN